MKWLRLEWRILDDEHVALVFDKSAWAAFEQTAALRATDASEMIAEALAGLMGEENDHAAH
jgi:hypothetical protein